MSGIGVSLREARTGLIALDFDGTIVDRSGRVSPRCARALDQAKDQGWVVVGATGRPASICADIVAQVPAMRFLVASNGAEVFRVGEPAAMFSCDVSVADARTVIAAIRDRWPTAKVCLGCPDGTQLWEVGFDVAVPVAPVGRQVDDALAEVSGPVRSIVVYGDAIERLGVDANAALDELVSAVTPRLVAAASGLGIPEVRRREVSKASAVEELRLLLGVEPDATLAFGDGSNDDEMLSWANCGIAMQGANEETVMVANAVTASVEADGVAVWLEEHVLGV